MKYKIIFKGFTVVEANSEEEAKQMFDNEEHIIKVTGTSDPEMLSEKEYREICHKFSIEDKEDDNEDTE